MRLHPDWPDTLETGYMILLVLLHVQDYLN